MRKSGLLIQRINLLRQTARTVLSTKPLSNACSFQQNPISAAQRHKLCSYSTLNNSDPVSSQKRPDDAYNQEDWSEEETDTEMEEHVKQKVSVHRARHSSCRFVDRIRIKAIGGHGGNGCSSFLAKTAYKKRPNGGHGGAGGDVIIRADSTVQDLANATHHFKGGRGQNGKSHDGTGRAGKSCIVRVPCGTVVKQVFRHERENVLGDYEIVDRMESVCDLSSHGQEFLAAPGGKPGLGNRILLSKRTAFGSLRKEMSNFKSAGQPGTSAYFELELKTIADVGLIGYPNAGKSTLLSTLSRASPKIAPYPFTTLHPFVGILEFPDCYKISIADIPGLIDGAHRNVGLGHDFLRHIQRTKVLVYVLDVSDFEGRDPLQDFHHLQRELELYSLHSTKRPSIVVVNKMDQPGAEANLLRLRKEIHLPIYPISALHKVDIEDIAASLRRMLENRAQESIH